METKKKTYLLTLFFALLFAFFLVNSHNSFFLQSLFSKIYANYIEFQINTNTIINILSNILLFVSLVFLLIYYIESNIEKKKRALTLVYLSLSCTSIILILSVLSYTIATTLNYYNYYIIPYLTVVDLLTIVNLLTFMLKIPFIVCIIICCAILIFKTITCLNINKLFKIVLSIFTGYLVLNMFSIFVILPFLLSLFKLFNYYRIFADMIVFAISFGIALLEIHIKLSNILLAFICLVLYIILLINIFKKKNSNSKSIKCLSFFIPIIIILLSIVIKIITYFLSNLIPLLILLINYL